MHNYMNVWIQEIPPYSIGYVTNSISVSTVFIEKAYVYRVEITNFKSNRFDTVLSKQLTKMQNTRMSSVKLSYYQVTCN